MKTGNEPRNKILVVDDEIINVDLITAILEIDYEIIKAYNGKEALQKIDSFNPDIVLLDIMMPVMDGYETCRRIRQQDHTHFTPVVMITAIYDQEAKIKAIEVGVDDFLTKPINRLELITRVKSLLKEKYFHDMLIKSNEQIEIQNQELKRTHTELELRVKERTDELQKANDELKIEIIERRCAEEEIKRRSEIQTYLNKLLSLSLQNISITDLLEQVIEILTSIPWSQVESQAGIWMVEDEPDVLVMKAQKGLNVSLQTTCARVPFGRCVCGRAALFGKIEYAAHIDENHDNVYFDMQPHGHYCVPLVSRGKIVGIINMYLRDGYERNERDVEFLTSIADVIVIVIERKQAEEALIRSNEFSKTVINSMNDALCIINIQDFKIEGMNNVFLREAGLEKEGVIGKTCFAITHNVSKPCNGPDDICPLMVTKQTGKYAFVEHVHHGICNEKKYVEISTSPIFDDGGKVVKVIHITRDITSRKLSEERLKQANLELKRADELKTQFLSVVSHELRTPLTPMKAQLQMILAGYFGDVTEKQKRSLDMILRNSTRLDRLIGDVLDISKLEAGVMKFNFMKATMNEIVGQAVETMLPKAENKNIKLRFIEEITPEILIDTDKITQVIINLINNALKFTDDGGSIKVALTDDCDHATVSINDNGIGIKIDDQKKLFKPFVQVDSSYTRKYEGSGLGLSICKGIVNSHGGKIWIESEFGKGSTFRFTIPYRCELGEDNNVKVNLDNEKNQEVVI
jgi:two-component system, sporulation sensor kinase E